MQFSFKTGFKLLIAKFLVFYAITFSILSYLNSLELTYSIFPFLIPLELGLFLLLLAREKLLQIPEMKLKLSNLMFLIPAGIFFFLRLNSEWMFRDLFSVIGFFFLAITVFGYETVKFVWRQAKKEAIIASSFFAAYRLFFVVTLQFWNELAKISASIVQFLLKFSFPESQLTVEGLIRLGTNKFDVIVAQECAGIESLVLFFVMYLVAASIDFKKLNKKRFVLALVLGMILLFLLSIIRLYLIMLIGLLYDPFFAVNVFHKYSSLVIFVGFFLIYWHYSFKWVKSRKKV